MQEKKWNLTSLANSDTDSKLLQARQQAQAAITAFVAKWQSNPVYLTQPDQLKIALDDYEELMSIHGLNGLEWYYFNLRSAQDQLSTSLKGKLRFADEEVAKQYNLIQFFTLNISKLDKQVQSTMLCDPQLANYKHFLTRLFRSQDYLLSEAEEKILNLVSQPAHQSWVSMTSTFLSQEQCEIKHEDGKIRQTTFTEVLSLINSQDKDVRGKAGQQADFVMDKHVSTATEELNAILQFKKTTDELRGFSRPEADRHLSDDIDTEVVDSMVKEVSQAYTIANDYYSLKAQLMGVEKLEYLERNVPFGSLNQNYSFDESASLVESTLDSLDPEFSQIFNQFKSNGQFDVYPRPGKVGGAFCAHNLITQPTYILLNHTNKLQDVLTLAHEMGHGIHNELARKSQNALNFGTSLATAEVASTFMEDFVMEKLLISADKNTQLAVMMMKLNDDISSIFRQVACYRFEQELHASFKQAGYLSSQEIGQIFQKHMAAYMGPAVKQSPSSPNWWVYWSHIRNFFYVYSYASGLLISKSLQALVRKDATNIRQVKQFMAAGQSDSPCNIFKRSDIDINQAQFWQQGLNEIQELYNKTRALALEMKLISK